MNLKDYLSVTPEIQEAIDAGKPVVALESTILSHGMPYPQNVEFAHKVEEIVRAEGAVPATTAIMGGKLKVGLNAEELLVMCKAEGVGKVSRRDVAVYLATGMTGATTVATTMILANMAGRHPFLRHRRHRRRAPRRRKDDGHLRRPAGTGQHPRLCRLRGRKEHSGSRPDAGISRDAGRSCSGPAHG